MTAYQSPENARLALPDNTQALLPQGFELPRGCLMTAVFILLPVLTMVIGLLRANSSAGVLLAVLLPALWMSLYGLVRVIDKRTGRS